jgi:hypothetical protein
MVWEVRVMQLVLRLAQRQLSEQGMLMVPQALQEVFLVQCPLLSSPQPAELPWFLLRRVLHCFEHRLSGQEKGPKPKEPIQRGKPKPFAFELLFSRLTSPEKNDQSCYSMQLSEYRPMTPRD